MSKGAYILGKILEDNQDSIDIRDQGVKKGDIYLILEPTEENIELAKSLFLK